MPPADSEFKSLKNWLTQNGGYVHPALVHESREGLGGIYWGEDSTALVGEVLVDIPRDLVIGPGLAGDYIIPADISHERDQALFILLAELEKCERSRFFPWLNQLPTLAEFKSYHPFFASEDELATLGLICKSIPRTIANFKTRLANFRKLSKDRFSQSQVLWAGLIYLTRAFAGSGLIPFCDAFNHHARNGRGLVDDRFIKAGANLVAGDQVFISYGAHVDSLELWLHFGFIDREAGPVINCQNVKSSQYVFGHDCYIDSQGPSPALLRACGHLNVYDKLKKTLLSELGDAPDSTSPLVQLARQLVLSRATLLA